ncbi:hypothetical protein DERP_013662 [Dermatophagoides pteronyssinus]|uniref:Uncharacterized protein n=1 Tax=Dermatophagoides pteronyssinus TaxID=6956 RepID=A0ABQ8JVI6_DERPT|nr:hypothetical protein DERP_013662 [Dermatophagoides pteronyssinus]
MFTIFTLIIISMVMIIHCDNPLVPTAIDEFDSKSININDDFDYMNEFDDANQMLTDLDQLLNQIIQQKQQKDEQKLQKHQDNLSSMLMAKNMEHVRYKDNSPIRSSSASVATSASTKNNIKDDNNIGQLLNNLNDLDKKLQSTFHDLQQRRRYVLGAMIRQMQYTVRRIRMNVTRMQQQLQSVDVVVTQMPLLPRPILTLPSPQPQSSSSAMNQSTPAPPEFTVKQMQINKELIKEIEDRLSMTSKKINDIVVRLNQSLMANIDNAVAGAPDIGVGAAPAPESSSPEEQPKPPQEPQPVEIAVSNEERISSRNSSGQDASSAAIRIPVDNANKLLYDLDAQVRQLFDDTTMIPMKEEKSDDNGEMMIDDVQSYSAAAANRELDLFPRQTESNAQQASLLLQLENLEKRLLSTINELQTRRRYFSSTMLRQMYNSVHRIRVNISRIQNQFSAPQSQSQSSGGMGGTRPGQSGMMQNLQQRVTDLQKAVNDIINRVTSTFQPNASKPTTGGGSGHHHQLMQQ